MMVLEILEGTTATSCWLNIGILIMYLGQTAFQIKLKWLVEECSTSLWYVRTTINNFYPIIFTLVFSPPLNLYKLMKTCIRSFKTQNTYLNWLWRHYTAIQSYEHGINIQPPHQVRYWSGVFLNTTWKTQQATWYHNMMIFSNDSA